MKDFKENLLIHPYVRSVRDGDLILFTYTPDCQFARAWDQYTCAARGLILSDSENRVVARPYPKFFNLSEYYLSSEIQDNQKYTLPHFKEDIFKFSIDRVTEKDDGSLGIFYWHGGEWKCATKGSFKSEQAIKGKELFYELSYSGLLDKNYTYLGEIIYKDDKDKKVLDYGDWDGVILQSAYHNESGHEVEFAYINDIVKNARLNSIKVVNTINCPTLEDCIDWVSRNTDNKEGVVVRFTNGIRVKIKNDKYLALHKLISNITESRVKELLYINSDYRSVIAMFPEEFRKDVEAIANPLLERINNAYEFLNKFEEYKNKTSNRKEFAMAIKDLNGLNRSAFFCLYSGIPVDTVKEKIRENVLT